MGISPHMLMGPRLNALATRVATRNVQSISNLALRVQPDMGYPSYIQVTVYKCRNLTQDRGIRDRVADANVTRA